MMTWPCFTVRETILEARWLRRYTRTEQGKCALSGHHHDARARIEDGPASWRLDMPIRNTSPTRYYHGHPDPDTYRHDPRWPERCSCGRPFAESDEWQVLSSLIYRADDGREWPQRELPIGALFDAAWHHAFGHVGPDGLSLTVVLPPGAPHFWCIDGPATDGGRWTRTGIPPAITASPSILTGSYHGFLQNGALTDCLPDRAGELARATAAIAAGRS